MWKETRGETRRTNITNPDRCNWCQMRKIIESFSGWSKVHFPILFLEGCSRSIYLLQPLIDPKDWCYCLMMNHPEHEGKSVFAALDTQSTPQSSQKSLWRVLFWSPEIVVWFTQLKNTCYWFMFIKRKCLLRRHSATFAHCHKECMWSFKMSPKQFLNARN